MYAFKIYEGIMVVYTGLYEVESILCGIPTWKVEAFA